MRHLNKNDQLCDVLSRLIDTLKEKKQSADKVLIYCTSIVDCAKLYQLFDRELGEISQQGEKLFAMYHSSTPEKLKRKTLSSLMDAKGFCRVVFAPSALGMGVNIPDVRTVVNYGLPKDLEEYTQMYGRAGRDG